MDRTPRVPPAELLKQDHFTVNELANLLEMSPYTIRAEVREGRLKAFIVNHHVVDIRRSDVLEWLQRFHPHGR
jgi:excisionase family DNA binding protein